MVNPILLTTRLISAVFMNGKSQMLSRRNRLLIQPVLIFVQVRKIHSGNLVAG
jgi:hypothetical protein